MWNEFHDKFQNYACMQEIVDHYENINSNIFHLRSVTARLTKVFLSKPIVIFQWAVRTLPSSFASGFSRKRFCLVTRPLEYVRQDSLLKIIVTFHHTIHSHRSKFPIINYFDSVGRITIVEFVPVVLPGRQREMEVRFSRYFRWFCGNSWNTNDWWKNLELIKQYRIILSLERIITFISGTFSSL